MGYVGWTTANDGSAPLVISLNDCLEKVVSPPNSEMERNETKKAEGCPPLPISIIENAV